MGEITEAGKAPRVIFIGDRGAGKRRVMQLLRYDETVGGTGFPPDKPYPSSRIDTINVEIPNGSVTAETHTQNAQRAGSVTVECMCILSELTDLKMHTAFFSSRAVYVIVCAVCAGDHSDDIMKKTAPWMEEVKWFAPGCPVIVVLNSLEGAVQSLCQPESYDPEYRKHNSNFTEICETSVQGTVGGGTLTKGTGRLTQDRMKLQKAIRVAVRQLQEQGGAEKTVEDLQAMAEGMLGLVKECKNNVYTVQHNRLEAILSDYSKQPDNSKSFADVQKYMQDHHLSFSVKDSGGGMAELFPMRIPDNCKKGPPDSAVHWHCRLKSYDDSNEMFARLPMEILYVLMEEYRNKAVNIDLGADEDRLLWRDAVRFREEKYTVLARMEENGLHLYAYRELESDEIPNENALEKYCQIVKEYLKEKKEIKTNAEETKAEIPGAHPETSEKRNCLPAFFAGCLVSAAITAVLFWLAVRPGNMVPVIMFLLSMVGALLTVFFLIITLFRLVFPVLTHRGGHDAAYQEKATLLTGLRKR